jgi:hypothetical protein
MRSMQDEDRLREPKFRREDGRSQDDVAIREGGKGIVVMPATPEAEIEIHDFIDGMPGAVGDSAPAPGGSPADVQTDGHLQSPSSTSPSDPGE